VDETRRGSSEEEPPWETSVSETRLGPSEEGPSWETLVSKTRSGSSEEEPPWEAPGEGVPRQLLRGGSARGNTRGARPWVEAPKSRCLGWCSGRTGHQG
jgi:hypothetical protein